MNIRLTRGNMTHNSVIIDFTIILTLHFARDMDITTTIVTTAIVRILPVIYIECLIQRRFSQNHCKIRYVVQRIGPVTVTTTACPILSSTAATMIITTALAQIEKGRAFGSVVVDIDVDGDVATFVISISDDVVERVEEREGSYVVAGLHHDSEIGGEIRRERRECSLVRVVL